MIGGFFEMVKIENEKIVIICFGFEWDSWLRRSNRILLGLSEEKNIKSILFFERSLTLRNIFDYFRDKANFITVERCKRFFHSGPLVRINEKIYVGTTLIPFVYIRYKWTQIVNEKFRYLQHKILISYFYKKMNVQESRILLWFNRPEFNRVFLDKINCWKILYDCTEDYIELLSGEDEYLFNKHKVADEFITKRADIVTVAPTTVFEKKSKINPHTYFISNGVDYESFVSLKNNGKKMFLGNYQHPILGFIGILNDRHDLNALVEIASKHENWSIILIGHANKILKNIQSKNGLSNIYFIDGMPAKDIPACLSEFDVCLCPYKVTYLNNTGGSMKLYQYLASGKPIVSYEVAGAEYFKDVIYIAKDTQEFAAMVEKALEEPLNDPKVNKRKEYARQNDWKIKIEKFCGLIRDLAGEDSN